VRSRRTCAYRRIAMHTVTKIGR